MMLNDKEKHEYYQLKFMEMARQSLEYFTLWTYPRYKVNWHHRLIFDKLDQFIYTNEINRLILMAPPRHGKTEIVSRRLPAFLFGINPNIKIIATSYSSDLASSINRDVQRIMESDAYKRIFPKTMLAGDSRLINRRSTQAKKNSEMFDIVDKEGVYISAGVGGPITGKGTNCFVADTKINCYSGCMNIQDIAPGELVLSFDHSNNKYEYNRVIATRISFADEFIEIKTKRKKSFTCTADHRIFAENCYQSAIQCYKGQKLITSNSIYKMQLLQKNIYKPTLCSSKSDKKQCNRSLLFSHMLRKSPCYKKQKKMRNLQYAGRKENKKILRKMQTKHKYFEITKAKLSDLRQIVSAEIPFDKMLFKKMRKYASFKKNAQAWKSKIQDRKGISSFVSKAEKTYIGKRFLSVPGLFRKNQIASSPYRRKKRKQLSCKSNSVMQILSHNSSQIEHDAILSVKKISNKQIKVYDIQVEKNNNFFAEGILVHNCLIIDDPIKNQEEADSELKRQKIWDWYRSTAYTRLEDNAKILLMMTRWHESDLAGKILELAKATEDADQWHVINLPAEAEHPIPDYDPRKIGDPLWPWKYNAKALKTIKATAGARVWNSLYQQRPSAAEGNIFKRMNWQMFTRYPSKPEKIIQSWDLTFKKKEDSDFVACTILAKEGANVYVLDRLKERMSFTETIKCLKIMSGKWPQATAKLIEEKANGDALVDVLKSEIPGLILVNPKGGKIQRAQAISPYQEAGNIFLPLNAHWVDDFIEEHANFPNGKHDDQVDSLSQGVLYLLGNAANRLKQLAGL